MPPLVALVVVACGLVVFEDVVGFEIVGFGIFAFELVIALAHASYSAVRAASFAFGSPAKHGCRFL